jgi:hypothetical protein
MVHVTFQVVSIWKFGSLLHKTTSNYCGLLPSYRQRTLFPITVHYKCITLQQTVNDISLHSFKFGARKNKYSLLISIKFQNIMKDQRQCTNFLQS